MKSGSVAVFLNCKLHTANSKLFFIYQSFRNLLVRIDASVAQERPALANDVNPGEVTVCDQNLFVLITSLCDDDSAGPASLFWTERCERRANQFLNMFLTLRILNW